MANIHDVDIALTGRPVGENGLVTSGEVARVDESIGNTGTTQGRIAGGFVATGDSTDVAGVRLGGGVDIGKDVTLDQDVGVLTHVEGVTAVPVPVVVVGVPMIGELDLGRAARSVMDVVVGKSYQVILAIAKTSKEEVWSARWRDVNAECIANSRILTRSSSGVHRKKQTNWCGHRTLSWKW